MNGLAGVATEASVVLMGEFTIGPTDGQRTISNIRDRITWVDEAFNNLTSSVSSDPQLAVKAEVYEICSNTTLMNLQNLLARPVQSMTFTQDQISACIKTHPHWLPCTSGEVAIFFFEAGGKLRVATARRLYRILSPYTSLETPRFYIGAHSHNGDITWVRKAGGKHRVIVPKLDK